MIAVADALPSADLKLLDASEAIQAEEHPASGNSRPLGGKLQVVVESNPPVILDSLKLQALKYLMYKARQ